jgi:O86/O127-antigen biosynthesis alpha-1,3-N-acetylgalactosaminyltransferase
MNNIAFIITKSEVGGAQKFVSDQIQYLKKSNFDLYLITNENGWLTIRTKQYLCGTLIDRGIESIKSITFLNKLIRFIKDNNIDLLICNSANGGLYGRIAALWCKRKSIYVSHGWSSMYNGGKLQFFYNKIEYLLSLISTSILCVSDNDVYVAREKIGINPKIIKLIYNSIPNNREKVALKIKKTAYNLLSVSRLEHPKRIDLIIDAVKDIENVNLNIVGKGSYEQYLKEKVVEEKIKNIVFVGEVEGFDMYHEYDIFILISESEGLPMSAIEAMSNGLPVIISNVGGCGVLIKQNGELVENNIISIQKGIINTIKNYEKYSINSWEHFNSNFNIDHIIDVYIDYYKKVLES